MTAVITNNVIKISTNNTPNSDLANNSTKPEYPKTCDFCRDTYNSELTYIRHKETGKCFRFCRLLEEKRLRQNKPPKISIYPRVCEGCSKLYKNKHSYYKHKSRCAQLLMRDDDITLRSAIDSASTPTVIDVDVVELAKDDIENIPIADNKENIDDFSSKFILTLDVDKNYSELLSLYPRICEICHKVFKTQESFESHQLNQRCSESAMRKKLPTKNIRQIKPSFRFFTCDNCGRVIHHKQLYNSHIKRCGKSVISTISSLKKPPELVGVRSTQPAESQPNADSPGKELWPRQSPYSRRCAGCMAMFTSKSTYYRHHCSLKNVSEDTKKGIYPRTCEYCGFVFQNKFQFHRHKQKCAGYQDESLVVDEDSYVSCDPCSANFDSLYLYRQHMKYVHPDMKTVQIPVLRKYMYPRKCLKCYNVYLTRQTFCNHKKRCVLSIDTHVLDDMIDEPGLCLDENAEKVTYPRTCNECQHTYSNRQSFCNHKRLCPDFVDSGKEPLLYPRRCEYCLKIYSSKQTYHHHKVRCAGCIRNETRKAPVYPRTCNACSRTFAYKHTYHNHLMECLKGEKSVSEEENRYSDENVEHNDLDWQSKQMCPKRIKVYPRTCEVCHKTYANRHTFCKHKSRCASATSLVDSADVVDTRMPLPEPVSYPRECENCFGTFKNKTTFNAHKIRCDFFETKVNEAEFKALVKSDCEHCRNIVSQYRRILHQHLTQCTDPIIKELDPLLVVEKTSKPIEPMPSSSEGANFCECCGMFFKSRKEIENHKKKLQLAEDSSLFECPICMETFDLKEELADHKTKCILNVGNRTYPRFCECCRKVYKTKQTFYNHKKNCHVHCLKYFVRKDCENCKLPFKCEKMYFDHVGTCVGFDYGAIAAECEVSAKPACEEFV